MNHIHLTEVDSTNTYAKQHAADFKVDTLISAHTQTGGRGQRGNSWEAEPGANLTLSIVTHPTAFPAIEQFAISEAFALAIVSFLQSEFGIEAKVKWPNDIYVGDRKICGILIEHSLTGQCIDRTIAGAGININQTLFFSPAPNPVSVAQLTGLQYDLSPLYDKLASLVRREWDIIATPQGREQTHRRFMSALWRGDGRMYPFEDTATGRRFMARIADISPRGFLTLTTADGTPLPPYAFKEVTFIL